MNYYLYQKKMLCFEIACQLTPRQSSLLWGVGDGWWCRSSLVTMQSQVNNSFKFKLGPLKTEQENQESRAVNSKSYLTRVITRCFGKSPGSGWHDVICHASHPMVVDRSNMTSLLCIFPFFHRGCLSLGDASMAH